MQCNYIYSAPSWDRFGLVAVFSDHVPSYSQEIPDILRDAFFLAVSVYGLFKIKFVLNIMYALFSW